MRLSQYPYVVVRMACTKCVRRGKYRLARLADKYGSEIEVLRLMEHLVGECVKRDMRHHVYDYCGAYFVDLKGPPRPPDEPYAAGRPKFKVVGER